MFLSDKTVKNAKPSLKTIKLRDGDGLFLQIDPKGSKYWRFRYRHNGVEKTLALGMYPAITLAEARTKRLDARKSLAAGNDPSAQKRLDKQLAQFHANNSFESVAREWFDVNRTKWSPDHHDRSWRRLEANIIPPLGKRPISEITALELLDTIRYIEKRGATELSRRLLQICSNIFRYAIITSRAKYNPAVDLKGALKPHRAVSHPTIKASELPKFLEALEHSTTTAQNKLAIRLLILTFMRQGELRQTKWEDIDFAAREWRIPAHITKMRELHIVPLSNQTIDILEELRQYTGWSKYLLPSQKRCRHAIMSENTINSVIHDMGYKGQLVGHGFRALASTTLNEHGFRPDVIERQLAHMERDKIRAAYNRAEYLPERRQMMQWWADFIDQSPSNKIIHAQFGGAR